MLFYLYLYGFDMGAQRPKAEAKSAAKPLVTTPKVKSTVSTPSPSTQTVVRGPTRFRISRM